MRVVLIRHPAPDIAAGICYGRLDVGLAPAVRRDLARYAAHPALQNATRIWTSPARRCHDLACVIGGHPPTELVVDERLLELDFGEWEGQSWNDIPRTSLDEWAASPAVFAPPGGESGVALIQRVSAFFRDMCEGGQDCVVISHGGPLKILIALLKGQPIHLLVTPPPIGSITVTQG